MLERLEMHDIQDKTRMMDEMNETRTGVNDNRDLLNTLVMALEKLTRKVEAHLKPRLPTKALKPRPRRSKPKTGPVNAKSYSRP